VITDGFQTSSPVSVVTEDPDKILAKYDVISYDKV
jgi:hypothetical protein